MNTRTGRAVAATMILGLLALVPLVGCSEAKAEPIEVTYYYLPG